MKLNFFCPGDGCSKNSYHSHGKRKLSSIVAFGEGCQQCDGCWSFDHHHHELFVSETHVYVVRKGSRGKGELVVKKPLSAIAKITSKKRSPEVITFKYGSSQGDSIIISDMDRFIIPRANEATSLISELIVKILEKKEEESNRPTV